MGRKRVNAPEGAPPPGAGGSGYRKRVGKIGITVTVSPAERDALRIAAAVAGFRSMGSYLLALWRMFGTAFEQVRQEEPSPAAPEKKRGKK